jgi:hypothetical protein
MAKKRPGQFSDNEATLARKQKTAESRDDEGKVESDMRMDAVSIQEHHTEVQQELPPDQFGSLIASNSSTSQVDGLAVPEIRASEMVVDRWTTQQQADLDNLITSKYPLPEGQFQEEITLPGVLEYIAGQNNKDISLDEAMMLIQKNEWLRKRLIASWEENSFKDIRRLSECLLYTFRVSNFS